MYIRGLIPRNFAELADAVPIGSDHTFKNIISLAHGTEYEILVIIILLRFAVALAGRIHDE